MQAKLRIGEPGDVYEQEADRIADQLMLVSAHTSAKMAARRIQRLGASSVNTTDAVPVSVEKTLVSPGRPLDTALRYDMEQRFGHDFSSVRTHTGAAAEQSARDVRALAYTVGQNIVFGAGQFSPGTQAGRRLLAHELTHVVQQSGAERFSKGSGRLQRQPGLDRDTIIQRQRDPGTREDEPEPDFESPQQRGGRARAAFLDAGRRGEDQVRVAVTRYLCDCVGRNVTRARASGHLQPGPGITLEICRGRVTARVTGDVVPSSFSTGRATVRGEVNVAPGAGGTGVRVGAEGEVRNTGSEPQVGGRVDARVSPPRGPEIGVSGEVFRGTESGRVDTSVTGGVEVNVPGLGRTRIGVGVTNPQDERRGGQIVIGGNLPGQSVQNQTCRECRCPVVYECLEDIPPREYEETVTFEVEERNRLRYYFSLDTNRDTTDPALRAESQRVLDEVQRRVTAGARIASITGYASPEDNRERPAPNEELSLSRAERLRGLLVARLDTAVHVPPPTAGGELLGRVATIAPGSRLADAILGVGFGDPEDVTTFLLGTAIPNPQLADQFLALLQRVTQSDDRLRLFGIDASSPAAPHLLAAIEAFVRARGRGRRPWEGIFGYLRLATVELTTTQLQSRQESRQTLGSLTPMRDAQCKPYARQAEREAKFGPAEPEPESEAACPLGEARNPRRFETKCDYD